MPKAILPEDFFRRIELLTISDERWGKIKSQMPAMLSAEADARLRSAILECCSWFLTQQRRLHEGQASAAALRRPGKRQLAPFERLARGLRMAADAWAKIGKIHDDRLGDIGRYENLEAMAADAERRLRGIRALGKPINVAGPWHLFVRKIARCCRDAGLNPTATGRVYEHAKPTWFQKFMIALNENLLGHEGKDKQLNYSRTAFHAEIAKALRGDGRRGKARK